MAKTLEQMLREGLVEKVDKYQFAVYTNDDGSLGIMLGVADSASMFLPFVVKDNIVTSLVLLGKGENHGVAKGTVTG